MWGASATTVHTTEYTLLSRLWVSFGWDSERLRSRSRFLPFPGFPFPPASIRHLVLLSREIDDAGTHRRNSAKQPVHLRCQPQLHPYSVFKVAVGSVSAFGGIDQREVVTS